MTYLPEPNIRLADGKDLDAFGRLRTVLPITLFESKQTLNTANQDFAEKLVGTASSTWVENKAATELSVTTTGDQAIRQTKQRFVYQPGRSLQVALTGVLAQTLAPGATSRIGYMDGYNGLFYELEDTTMYVVNRNDEADTRIPQSQWNLDTLDGYGPSGINLDPTKVQIFTLDFQWLGAGRARMGFNLDGVIIYAHEFIHANLSTQVYMANPNLPIRYEVISTGAARTLDKICAAITGEGTIDPAGDLKAVDRGTTTLTNVSTGALVPVISIRLNPNNFHSSIIVSNMHLVSTSNGDCRYTLLFNPTVTGPDNANWQSVSNSTLQYDISRTTANTLTGGIQMSSGYLLGTNQAVSALNVVIDSRLRLGVDLDNVPDEIVLAIEVIGAGAQSFLGGMLVREII